MHRLLTDNDAIYEVCQRLMQAEFITLDTEFIRDRTYFPRLCLVQVAGPGKDDVMAIDPLHEGTSLAPLYEVLLNPKVLKVMHACRQDVEIFYRLMGELPRPMYDTQIAAMVCGYGESVGYEQLVAQLLSKGLDKASRFTDWSKRPLTQRQIDYALSDVTYLRDIYEMLSKRITETGREGWIAEEIESLSDPSMYLTDPDEAWRKLKVKNQSRDFLNLLRAAARWRELTAMKKDIPKRRVMNDDIVVEVVRQKPESAEEALRMRGMNKQLSKAELAEMLEAIDEAAKQPEDTHPISHKKKALPSGMEHVVDILKLLLKMQCTKHHVAPKLVAGKEDIVMIATGEATPEKTPALHGWRYEVFGKLAQQFLNGELVMSKDPKSPRLRFTEKG